MFRLLQIFGKYQSARGALGGLPSWARLLLLIVALPGMIGILAAILLFGLSILILLLLTMPVFRLLQWMGIGGGASAAYSAPTDFVTMTEPSDESQAPTHAVTVESVIPDRPRRQVDVRIVE